VVLIPPQWDLPHLVRDQKALLQTLASILASWICLLIVQREQIWIQSATPIAPAQVECVCSGLLCLCAQYSCQATPSNSTNFDYDGDQRESQWICPWTHKDRSRSTCPIMHPQLEWNSSNSDVLPWHAIHVKSPLNRTSSFDL